MRPTDQVLEVGCGTGALLYELLATHQATRLYGVDPVPGMLAMARQRLPPAVNLRAGWAEQLPFGSKQFDVVICGV